MAHQNCPGPSLQGKSEVPFRDAKCFVCDVAFFVKNPNDPTEKPSGHYLRCIRCRNTFHAACVQVTRAKAKQLEDNFVCPFCVTSQPTRATAKKTSNGGVVRSTITTKAPAPGSKRTESTEPSKDTNGSPSDSACPYGKRARTVDDGPAEGSTGDGGNGQVTGHERHGVMAPQVAASSARNTHCMQVDPATVQTSPLCIAEDQLQSDGSMPLKPDNQMDAPAPVECPMPSRPTVTGKQDRDATTEVAAGEEERKAQLEDKARALRDKEAEMQLRDQALTDKFRQLESEQRKLAEASEQLEREKQRFELRKSSIAATLGSGAPFADGAEQNAQSDPFEAEKSVLLLTIQFQDWKIRRLLGQYSENRSALPVATPVRSAEPAVQQPAPASISFVQTFKDALQGFPDRELAATSIARFETDVWSSTTAAEVHRFLEDRQLEVTPLVSMIRAVAARDMDDLRDLHEVALREER